MNNEELLRFDEEARRLGYKSVRQIYNRVDAGDLHPVYIHAKRRRGMRIRASELEAFIAGRPERDSV